MAPKKNKITAGAGYVDDYEPQEVTFGLRKETGSITIPGNMVQKTSECKAGADYKDSQCNGVAWLEASVYDVGAGTEVAKRADVQRGVFMGVKSIAVVAHNMGSTQVDVHVTVPLSDNSAQTFIIARTPEKVIEVPGGQTVTTALDLSKIKKMGAGLLTGSCKWGTINRRTRRLMDYRIVMSDYSGTASVAIPDDAPIVRLQFIVTYYYAPVQDSGVVHSEDAEIMAFQDLGSYNGMYHLDGHPVSNRINKCGPKHVFITDDVAIKAVAKDGKLHLQSPAAMKVNDGWFVQWGHMEGVGNAVFQKSGDDLVLVYPKTFEVLRYKDAKELGGVLRCLLVYSIPKPAVNLDSRYKYYDDVKGWNNILDNVLKTVAVVLKVASAAKAIALMF